MTTSSKSDDDELDDPVMRSMRSVWVSMRDEEPPAAGMSGLLAAAREKADAMRAPTWWQRLFTQLRRPPALAFATVMLLVGGAVLVTRNVDDKVESETAAVAPPEELRVRESGENAYSRDQEAQKPAEPAIAQPTTPVDPGPAPAPEKLNPAPRPKKDVVVGGRKGGGKELRAGKHDEEDVGPNEPSRHDRFDGAAKSTFAEGTDTSGTTVLESPRVDPPKQRPAPAGEQVTITDDVRAATAPSEQLARQAESAASRGDCPAVRTIVAKLKQQDETVYKTRLAKNAAVTKCL